MTMTFLFSGRSAKPLTDPVSPRVATSTQHQLHYQTLHTPANHPSPPPHDRVHPQTVRLSTSDIQRVNWPLTYDVVLYCPLPRARSAATDPPLPAILPLHRLTRHQTHIRTEFEEARGRRTPRRPLRPSIGMAVWRQARTEI
jgi:hypothetical protein